MLSAVIELIAGTTHVRTEAPHAVAFAGWLLVHRIGQLTPPMLENPDRTMLRSVRRWAERVATDVYTDFPRPFAEGSQRPAGARALRCLVARAGASLRRRAPGRRPLSGPASPADEWVSRGRSSRLRSDVRR